MAFAQPASTPVIYADENTRADFLVKVYQHLALAVAAFVGIETLLFTTGVARGLYNILFGSGGAAWLLILGGFTIVQMIATRSAHSLNNPSVQYAGLFGMAAAEALIFAPFLYYTFNTSGGGSVASAAAVTAVGFGGLSVVGFVTRKDLSFLRPILLWGGFAALGLIVAAVLFGFELGIMFTVAMIALAGASILYKTQAIVRQYPEWAYVGAAVALFASLMMLFWYVLRLFARRR